MADSMVIAHRLTAVFAEQDRLVVTDVVCARLGGALKSDPGIEKGGFRLCIY
jgi:hypothetical protein